MKLEIFYPHFPSHVLTLTFSVVFVKKASFDEFNLQLRS